MSASNMRGPGPLSSAAVPACAALPGCAHALVRVPWVPQCISLQQLYVSAAPDTPDGLIPQPTPTPRALPNPLLQLHFWGIDSGIRHSVGGADYGSVRVGTFMGLAICSRLASAALQRDNSLTLLGRSGQQTIKGAAQDLAALAAAGAAAAKGMAVPGSSSGEGGGIGSSSSSGSSRPFGGYLANISPSQYMELFEEQLPAALTGAEFLERFGPHLDSVTRVEPGTKYAVRVPTAHPIHENARVNAFRSLLSASEVLVDAASASVSRQAQQRAHNSTSSISSEGDLAASTSHGLGATPAAAGAGGWADVSPVGGSPSITPRSRLGPGSGPNNSSSTPPAASGAAAVPSGSGRANSSSSGGSSAAAPLGVYGPLEVLGELMFQSHGSYSRCGLGSAGTNRLVSLVREHMAASRAAGRSPALFGAKITGGGCGGTVCVLGLAGPAGQAALDSIVAAYAAETGHLPKVFGGSSMGAEQFGHLKLKRRRAQQTSAQAVAAAAAASAAAAAMAGVSIG